MTTGWQVLSFLCAGKQWSIAGDDYDSIVWLEGNVPYITKEQFEAGFAQYDAWKAQQDAQAASDKASATAKLEALGLTADDLKTLGL